MQQFDLSLWLKDKSRKVVTRDGRPVRIICTDRNSRSGNIVGLVGKDESLIYVWNNDGKHIVSEIPDNDLFFADEEELTEFEKALVDLVSGWCDSHIETPEEYIDKYSRKLLNLARKELIPIQDTMAYQEGVKEGRRLERQDIDKELDEAYKSRDEVVYLEGYDKGYEDALKDLPKWKRAIENKEFEKHVCVMDYYMSPFLDTEVNEGDYYIELSDLKTLPKEE